jgi:ATP-dependent Clp protease protease subunit
MSQHTPSLHLVPTVIESSSRGERGFDLYSRLLRERIVFVNTPIDDALASLVTAQLLFLESEDPSQDVNLYIASGGGSVTAGFAIHDTMKLIKPEVSTIALGMTGSMATFLLASGTPGKRFALPNATIHFHPAGITELGGYAPDVEIHVRFLLDLQERANRLMARYTGQPYESIVQDFSRDRFFTAEEARRYGLVDAVAGAEIPDEGAAAASESAAA